MGKIEQLREFDGYDGEAWDDTYEEIDELLYGQGIKQVHSEFEEGGRWSNYETKVYEVTEGDDVAYFSVMREVPASETQDGMECTFEFNEVHPRTKTITVYE